VENYPELKASETYQKLMREITDQQENIGAAIRIFNQNVEDFNNGIEVFPNSLVNSMLNHKEKIKTFSDSQAEEGFEYKPNI
ncbi:LemA family protein, partial [Burkholderia sp. SIMBA_057]